MPVICLKIIVSELGSQSCKQHTIVLGFVTEFVDFKGLTITEKRMELRVNNAGNLNLNLHAAIVVL